VIPYALPFREPYVTSRGRLDRREMVLLRLHFVTGVTGLGEAVPLSLRGGTALDEVVRELVAWGRLAVAGAQTPSTTGMSAPARVATSMALSDAEAREKEIPLHTLLASGSPAEPVPCNATLTSATPEGVLAQAETWADDGFTVFKLKLGTGDDVAVVESLRNGLGPEVKIRIDANGSWELDEAAAILASIEPFDIELAEQPVLGLPGMMELREKTSIPLVADEDVFDVSSAKRAAEMGACDAVTVKLSKIGRLKAGLDGHLPTYLSSALDGPVGIAAAAHVAQILNADPPWDAVAHGLATERLFSSTIAEQGPLLDGAFLPVPSGNGIGITIDEAALEAHRL